ncbi:hypothetical protein AB0J57_32030 [Streptomyces sp. NPDC049837]|uniref:winged helix-turn-helix transcriptional regulator n=1 Tax=Streptomyces sp. NPDC049837 TaxID=3155277 RepID=UPI0034400F72
MQPGPDLGGDPFAADCRARVAFEVLANRWDSVVVYILGEGGPMRPRALLDRIGGISPKVLNDAHVKDHRARRREAPAAAGHAGPRMVVKAGQGQPSSL